MLKFEIAIPHIKIENGDNCRIWHCKRTLLGISYLFVNLGIKVKIECLKKRRSDFDTNLRETHRINYYVSQKFNHIY